MKVLRILANPKPVEKSVSLRVEKAFIEALAAVHPAAGIETFDVYQEDFPPLDAELLPVFLGAPEETEEVKRKMDRRRALLDQFMAADVYVFATPMWNFCVPPMLKAYMDCVLIARKTFRYTAAGAEGLMKGKKAVVISATGGNYDGELASRDMAGGLLMHYCRWIGIEDPKWIRVQGISTATPDEVETKVAAACAAAQALAAEI